MWGNALNESLSLLYQTDLGSKQKSPYLIQIQFLQRSLLFQRKCQSMSVVSLEINVESLVVVVWLFHDSLLINMCEIENVKIAMILVLCIRVTLITIFKAKYFDNKIREKMAKGTPKRTTLILLVTQMEFFFFSLLFFSLLFCLVLFQVNC